MAKTVFFAKKLEINDEQGRFEIGKSIRGSLVVDVEGNASFTPDKVNTQSKEIKPQPRKLYDGPMTGVKATIKVDGKMLTHLELTREKAMFVGHAIAEAELVNAFNEGWKELTKSA